MQKSETIATLAKALAKFQAEVSNPKNTAINPHFKSKYAPLQDILSLVRPVLAKHGLSIIQFPSGDGQDITISTILMHESGEWIEACPLTLKADKPTAQGAGSAITYGRRYTLSAVLGISSEDDDDGNSANKKDEKRNITSPPSSEKQTTPLPSGGVGTISKAQAKRMFALAGGNAEIVKEVIAEHGYERTDQIKKTEYDKLCKEIEAKRQELDKELEGFDGEQQGIDGEPEAEES